MLKVHAKNLGTVAVLCLQGRIVKGETEMLRKALHSLSEVSAVILDLARVTTVDAGGLGRLTMAWLNSSGLGPPHWRVERPLPRPVSFEGCSRGPG